MATLATLRVRNLVCSGIHGATGREIIDPQRFRVDVDVKIDIARAIESDQLVHTYDYVDAVHACKQVIEQEHHVLIEKIASRIASNICNSPVVDSVKVTVTKLNVSANGQPGIVVEKKNAVVGRQLVLKDFDIREVIDALDTHNGISIPILSEEYRKQLLSEAETYMYIQQPEYVGPANVREQLSSIKRFHPASLFKQLQDDFQKLFTRKLLELPKYPFEQQLNFNETSLQKYEQGSIGITPHMDGKSVINLICVFVIVGKARFAFCDDREGNNPRDLATTPGNVILFRAPGYRGSDFRPFHFVTDVTERRIVFGLRQTLKKD
jgi:dihydroneopterin aldolase